MRKQTAAPPALKSNFIWKLKPSTFLAHFLETRRCFPEPWIPTELKQELPLLKKAAEKEVAEELS